MADDHNALLARVTRRHPLQYGFRPGQTEAWINTEQNDDPVVTERYNRCPTCEEWSPCDVRTLVAELRALTSRHHTARALIAYLADLHDYHTGALPHMAESPDLTAEQVALYESVMADQAKDPDHE
jgi:hypothetical protein